MDQSVLDGFVFKQAISSEYATGIPKRRNPDLIPTIKKPTMLRLVVQSHPAVKAGDHYDIRLVDDVAGVAHSWATKKELPKPGENIKLYQTFTHTARYSDYEGPLGEGYGKTRPGEIVKKVLDVPIEIVQSDNNMIRMNMYGKGSPREIVLARDRHSADAWNFIDVTKTAKRYPDFPFYKPQYKETDIKKIDTKKDDEVFSAKIDGSHNIFILEGGKRPRVFSYRKPERGEIGLIEHSHKLPKLYNSEVPKALGNTIVRGEIYAQDKNQQPVNAETVAGMLNSNVIRSRDLQKLHGKLKASLFDIVTYKGVDMANAPYKDKLIALYDIAKQMPEFELPEIAITQKDKSELIRRIKDGAHPHTREGIIVWNLNKASHPIKAKLNIEHDVHIKNVEQSHDIHGKPKEEMGALAYSLKLRGLVVGKVGTGFSHAQRVDMWKRPQLYRDAVARVKAQKQYASGALSKPVFIGWHPDKSSPEFFRNIPIERT